MKILFLDIDGVLNNHTHMENGYCGIDRDKVRLLNKILDETECQIVITSAWRYMFLSRSMNIRGLENLFLTHGVKIHNRIFTTTISDEEIPTRGLQIQNILDLFKKTKYTYVVVDDMDLDITNNGHPFVKIDGKVGLTEKEAGEIIHVLNG